MLVERWNSANLVIMTVSFVYESISFNVKLVGAHVSLWMSSEDESTPSIAKYVGKKGTHFKIQKIKSTILLTVNGKFITPKYIFQIAYCKSTFQESVK